MTYWETAEARNPSAPEHELEFARIWKRLPKLVYSKSLEAVEGNTQLSRGDPVQEVQLLKEQDGGPIGVGGAILAASLTAHRSSTSIACSSAPWSSAEANPSSRATRTSTSS